MPQTTASTDGFWAPSGAGAGGLNFRRHLLILAAVWLVGTLLLFLFRPGYLFPTTDNGDSWLYTGYQWDLRNHLREFGPLYYGARLSSILPGAILHVLLPPVTANICLKLIVSALLATAGATVVYRALGLQAALLAVVLSVLGPQMIYALHTDYDIAAITYASLAVAGITLARDSKSWPAWILISGAMFAGMVVANLTTLGFPGLGIALYHLLWLRWGFRRQLLCLGLYFVAAAVVLGGLGVVNTFLGGDFLFMKSQFAMLSRLSGQEKNPWAPKDWRWLWNATWLVLPVCALVWGTFRSRVTPSGNARAQQLIAALSAGLATALAVAVGLELHRNPVLSLYYYMSFALCLAAPLLVACCASSSQRQGAPGFSFFGSLAILALIVLAFDPFQWGQRLVPYLPFQPAAGATSVIAPVPLLILAILALLGLAGGMRRRWRAVLRPEIFLVGIVAASIPIPFHSSTIFSLPRERYASVHAAFKVVRKNFGADAYRFWSHPEQPGSRPLTATLLWGYRLFTAKPFPQFDAVDVANLGDRTLIVTAPANRGDETLAQAKRALAGSVEITHAQIFRVPGDAGTGFDLVALTMGGIPLDFEHLDRTKALLDLNSRSSTGYVGGLEKNFYGSAEAAQSALTFRDSITWFKRTDPRDHLATVFRKLNATQASRQLMVVVEMPSDSQTLLVVQDDTFHSLQQFPLQHRGWHAYAVEVPAASQSIRLCLLSAADSATALPAEILVQPAALSAPSVPPGAPAR